MFPHSKNQNFFYHPTGLLRCARNDVSKSTLIFLVSGAPGTSGIPGAAGTLTPQQQADEEERERREAERLEEADRRQRQRSGVEQAPVSPEIKQRMREALASDNLERQNLVERLLNREINESQFKEAIDGIDRDDGLWKNIFTVQRNIRKQIQQLQYRAESYMELLPHRRTSFETSLKEVRKLNLQDDATDRSLKRELATLARPSPPQHPQPFLDAAAINEIYAVDPLSSDCNRILKKHQAAIEKHPSGKALFRKLVAFKKEEARAEQKFGQLKDQLNKLVSSHASRVRRRADEERTLKAASKAIGITIKPGTEIKYSQADILDAGDNSTVKIARVEFEKVGVFDHKGNKIDEIPGVPTVHLSNGAKMPLGRFKKWVDAVDATEVVSSIADVEQKTGLAAYGLKIEPGMMLSWIQRRRDQQQQITSTPVSVRITEIKDGMIHFSDPVLYQPGLEGLGEDEYRKTLSFGEFVKWWHRYEVEKSIGLQELQELLKKHNEMENKFFGIEAADNPPILIERGESLRYPDEIGANFRIESVDADGIALDTGRKYSFPEFFYWVKNNNVEKVPEQKLSQEEAAADAVRKAEVRKSALMEKQMEEMEIHSREEGLKATKHHEAEREAGSPIYAIKSMWWTTQFLSLKDFWNIGKELVEFVKRKHERRSKGRYGDVGSRLPWVFGPEFERVKQAAETEEVGKYKEAMEHWSVEKVKQTLHETTSKDIAKAAIQTLNHKGEMRWDDHHFWETLNRLTARHTLKGAVLNIPHPEHMPVGKSGEDMIVPAIDALWGAGQASEWIQENISKYNGNKKNFEYIFKQLENDPKGTGGPAGRLNDLLAIWRQGGYVNPQEYEEMIDAAIDLGKMTTEGKMFYMMAGVMARQGNRADGETLLHLDRLGELDSKYLNKFPILDFFTTAHIWDPVTKKLRKPNKLSDYEKWMRQYFPDEYRNGKPGPQFSRFIWEVVIPSEEVRTRMSKGIRNAENIDHDDAHFTIAPLTPTEVDQVTQGPSGQKKYFTNSGYANGYPGFNQYILSLSYALEEATEEKQKENYLMALRDAVGSFIRYDGILDNRFKRSEGDHRARLDDRHFSRKTVVGGDLILREYQEQLRNLVKEIGKAYGENFDWLYGSKFGIDKEGEQKQREYEQNVELLKDKISDMVKSDGGNKMLEVCRRARERGLMNERDATGLSGIPDSRRPKAEEIARLKASAMEYAMRPKHGGGHH